MSRSRLLIPVLLLSLAVAACGDDGNNGPTAPLTALQQEHNIARFRETYPNNTVVMRLNGCRKVTALSPLGAPVTVTFSGYDTSRIRVSPDGLIEALREGKTRLVVTSETSEVVLTVDVGPDTDGEFTWCSAYTQAPAPAS